jgi:regulator of CtrA degradation
MARIYRFEGCFPVARHHAGPEPVERGSSRIVTATLQTVTYFDSTFDEALALTREARDYLAYQEKADLSELSPVGRMAASCESMRMTARLTQVVAWLLVQKAVHAGDLTREEAALSKYRLAGQEVCDDIEPLAVEPLPERLIELLTRSHQMYQRIARLDAMFDGHQAFTG